MAQKYYNTEEVAEILGISADQVKEMQQDRKIYGYRDGTDWKYKVEEIDKIVDRQKEDKSPQPAGDEDQSDVLLSEVELGQSDPGASGTVIGMESAAQAEDSDIQLSGDDVVDSKVAKFEELDLTLEEDLSLDDSQLVAGDSDIDLTGKDLEDDDLVLGGSGVGSGISIGGDSGISLVDPADSGLSLEEPMEIGGSDVESLELGEDDLISLTDEAESDAPTELKSGDDDFLLTPLEEVDDADEDSESGSQVIALDTEGEDDGAATMLGGGEGGVAAMLDEDLEAQPAGMGLEPMDGGAPGMAAFGAQPGGFAEGAAMMPSDVGLPETPYSIWNVLGLAVCVLFLIFCGMFMYDLMRNMWSWDNPYSVNSSLMDTILGWFEG